MQIYNLVLPTHLNGNRLDKALSCLIEDISRSQVQKAIKSDNVTVNGKIINDYSYKTQENDVIKLSVIEPAINETLKPTKIELDIVYEDEDLIVLNKQNGLTVHPGAGNHQDTLVNALLHYSTSLSDVGEPTRPGIVHRLDKDTSGLMIVAKNNFAHNIIANQIAERKIIRKYKALIWGIMNPTSGSIDLNIDRSRADRTKMSVVKFGGKNAVTHYQTEAILLEGIISLLECRLETGRTHQIRVHLSNSGHSVVGDQVYGNNKRKINTIQSRNSKITEQNIQTLLSFKRQALHSCYIAFTHPRTDEPMSFEVDLPIDIEQLLGKIA
jgi:23S rRNA pseudouridine1911/1915/1917 synthase